MDIQKTLNELDGLYRQRRMEEAGAFLLQKCGEAGEEGDLESLVTLLNERIGYHRDRGEFDLCEECGRKAREILTDLGREGSIPYATTLLNIATAMRAEGKLREAEAVYGRVRDIYGNLLKRDDHLYAALYNNVSLLLEQRGDYERAAENLEKALEITGRYPEAKIELATSHTNLASVLLRLGRMEEARDHLDAAMAIFIKDGGKNPHYCMALSAEGEYFYLKGDYESAVTDLKMAMCLQESFTGRDNIYYRQLGENLEKIRRAMDRSMSLTGIHSPSVRPPREEKGVRMESGNEKKDREGDPVMDRMQLVDQVVAMEWKAFGEVNNEGGRAGCQDNRETFEIMRKSQYLTWTEEMLYQYSADFIEALQRGWNMVTEKYARMMESNAKEQYEALKNQLPELSDGKKILIELVVAIQVGWMEEFARTYPNLANNARAIHTSEDTEYNTSYETYLRGEVSTYSDKMMNLYASFIVGMYREGKNLCMYTMRLMTALYGYESLDAAEKKLLYTKAARAITDAYFALNDGHRVV